MGHALPELRLYHLGLFLDSKRLIQKNRQMIFGKIIQKGNRCLGKILDKAAQPVNPEAFLNLLGKLSHRSFYPGRLLGLHLFPQRPGIGLGLLLNLPQAFLHPLRQKQKLCSRVEGDFLKLFHRSLAFQVKAPDGVHLVAPQLNSDGQLLCQRENIDDSSADGKLPHAVHLAHSLVAQLGKPSLQLLQKNCLSAGHVNAAVLYFRQRKQTIHQSIRRSHHRSCLIFKETFKYLHSLAGQEISMNIGAVKQQVSGRIEIHSRIEGSVVLKQLPGSGIVVCDNQLPPFPASCLADQVSLL